MASNMSSSIHLQTISHMLKASKYIFIKVESDLKQAYFIYCTDNNNNNTTGSF